MTNPTPSAETQALMEAIRKKTDSIVRQQRIADTKGFSCLGAAISLQKLRRERQVLQAMLPPLALAT